MSEDGTRPLEAALAAHFGPHESLVRLVADASSRTFFRARHFDGSTRVIVIDEAGGLRGLKRMLAARDQLASIGIRVPKITRHADDLFALEMEDLGDRLLAEALPKMDRSQRRRAYTEAGTMAGRIARDGGEGLSDDSPLTQPRLERERLRTELAFFAVHDVASRRGCEDQDLLADLRLVLDHIALESSRPTPRFAHRDLHARNLMLLANGQLAAVDFQDALFAPPFYDLVSLVYDPYVALDDELRSAAKMAYLTETGESQGCLENPLYGWVALQRLLKAIGTYAFQASQRGKSRFAASIVTAERHALAVAKAIPSEMRGVVVEILERVGF